ncbi:thioredoxin domain-containing protein [Actinophytocola sp.]|uniref:thioredoxin domain-containing protein n=1 Tax=Actinophytocola sp. TaxID=1872138 RepID=UPI00389B3622
MANRLANATSPYLLQHADNPVDWWPWSDEAFAEARRRDVPILLSVGYAACHWCHVMAHESFEDPTTAAVMNEKFVNIKVDREERPDVDAVYMTATQAMTGQGGWPMTCFLTPSGEPFHCGTYYPPAPRPGMPSFGQLLEAVHEAWTSRDDEVRNAGGRIVEELRRQTAALPASTVDDKVLASSAAAMLGDYDRRNGGFGGAPKFPPSMVLEFLLRHHERTGSVEALSIVEGTARGMASGGIYDQLDGGFARYSVDAGWVVPHFEKMLYDNGLLLRLYTRLALRTGDPRYRAVAEETADFLLNRLRTTEGGFAASLDADTEGVEGLTYAWSPAQLTEVLGPEDGAWAANLFGVTEAGTFEHGTSTLRLLGEPDDRFPEVRRRLLEARMTRPQPARDDKVITAWNGLAIGALAAVGVAFDEPRWLSAAVAAAEFVTSTHLVDGRLRRASRNGVAGDAAGVLEDYGCLADALLTLHQATADLRWLTAAVDLLDTALAKFADPDNPGAYHDTAADAAALVWRPSDPSDNASPSGASALAGALLTASSLVGFDHASRYRTAAEEAVARAGQLAARAPRFAGHWLTVAEALATGPLQVAIVGEGGPLLRTAIEHAAGGTVIMAGEPDAAPLLADRPLVDGKAAAYVCHGYVCDRPVTEPSALIAALK